MFLFFYYSIMSNEYPKYLTPRKAYEIGMFNGLKLRTIRDKCRLGKIPCKNIGTENSPLYLIPENALSEL